ncbi:MAG: hypothetical protein F9K13_03220 [Candidatus Methylomirabilis oxygeniifera]|uniref:Uncharacterized protein n=1 Tax=Methylomirabilis oxygeniifera TaxID=671143 RepID=D5MFH9_METO1|nr:MAG: hypothetical protein F9K13_03220 [Candidatus Methylomirabilis oxyfera]CBE68510.1 exported protein of unknown function [Candidatus Methylomirabilis oxyfera]
MKIAKRSVAALVIGTLLVTSLFLLAADPASARTNFHFGLNLGVPLTPYPGYGYMYPYPPPVRYAPHPYYRAYPPCARVWIPGYYDSYGNWVFGYYQYDCGYYGY